MTASQAPIGQTLDQLATPVLVLDLDRFEHNLEVMQQLTGAAGVALRPHAKAHRCSTIAKAQMAAGAVGICCQTLGEAERFASSGLTDILISNVIVDPEKIKRLARLARTARLSLCADDESIVSLIAANAREAGSTVEVLVEIDVGDHRCGLAGEDAIVKFVQEISTSPHLSFGGLQAYIGRAQHERQPTERRKLAADAGAAALKIRDRLSGMGIDCPRITGGGTGTVADDCSLGALTEVQPGTYVFLDADYSKNNLAAEALRLQQSLFVLTQVISVAPQGHVICDAGMKSFSMESGFPEVDGREDLRAVRVSDEHVKLACSGTKPGLCQRLLLIPGHCDPTVNLHDWIVGFRSGRVEAVWAVDARGASA